ncbi:MAG: Holliday junction resolvase RuvX [Clostridia bacterium]
MRIVSLDVGTKRIGVAVSDPMGMIAQPYTVIYVLHQKEKTWQKLAELLQLLEAELIVIGLPRNMNGSYGPKTEEIKAFATELQLYTKLEIVFIDERLTTVIANKALLEGNVSRKNRKEAVDAMAAALILQTYLDQRKN